MSIDLEGWYITTKKPGYSVQGPEKLFLPVVGANHSHFPFEWWEADEKATFLEQYELVLNNCSWENEEEKEYYREKAREFKEKADKLGKPIRSYWL